jgi:hypothetical protein
MFDVEQNPGIAGFLEVKQLVIFLHSLG